MKRENKIQKKAIPFSYKTDPGKRVFIAGTFNEWDARELELYDSGNGDYSIALDLAPGNYEYKFIVDEEWCLDQDNNLTTCSYEGYINNVLILK